MFMYINKQILHCKREISERKIVEYFIHPNKAVAGLNRTVTYAIPHSAKTPASPILIVDIELELIQP